MSPNSIPKSIICIVLYSGTKVCQSVLGSLAFHQEGEKDQVLSEWCVLKAFQGKGISRPEVDEWTEEGNNVMGDIQKGMKGFHLTPWYSQEGFRFEAKGAELLLRNLGCEVQNFTIT